MELVGEYLKEERKKRKIDINQVSDDLKISKTVLSEIENDNSPEYVDRVFVIGHIRSYANYLNLDSETIIDNYKIQNFSNNNNSEIEIQKPIGSNNFIQINKVFSFASIVVISVFFYIFFIDTNNIKNRYAMTPDVPENLQSELEEAEMQIALEKQKKLDNTIENEFMINSMDGSLENIVNNSTSVVASLPSKDDLIEEKNIITLKFIDSTWVQLRNSNDEIILSKLMNKNDEYSYYLSENLYLTVGNAGNLIISINDIIKGKAGKSGEVIDSLIIDRNFNN
tara:strand:- start:164 stop:1009 length:846 start_codon:yes stop_codon:yes gene_type:complete